MFNIDDITESEARKILESEMTLDPYELQGDDIETMSAQYQECLTAHGSTHEYNLSWNDFI